MAEIEALRLEAHHCQWASRFLEDNREVPFYLMIDSFAPHEPWIAPPPYDEMYGDPAFSGKRHLSPRYGTAEGYGPGEIEFMQAQYRAAERRFTTTGFAYQPQGMPFID